MRRPRLWKASTCLLALLVPGLALAQPTTYPADSAYTATTCGTNPSFDPESDGGSATAERDIVGDSTYPALYYTDDGTYAYFRIRLEDDPIVTAGGNKPLAQFGWGVGLDTNNNTADVEYNIVANGITEVVSLVRVSDGAVLLTLQPTLDATNPPPYVPGYVEVTQAADGSSFGGDADYFLTIVVPMAALASATASDPSPISWGTFRVWAATSSNGTSLSGDFMCWDDGTGAVDLTQAVTEPVTIGASCSDGKLNGTETDIDCGGSCPACAIGKGCSQNTDCLSASCDSGTGLCVSPCPSSADGTDCDGDGLVNLIEDKDADGAVDPGETDPNQDDTDGDGVDDGVEDANKNGTVDPGETDPTNSDSDSDGLLDGVEDKNGNGAVDAGETDPLSSDTDGDGLPDGVEDANKNGTLDSGETDPTNNDTDGDGLFDGIEDANQDGSYDATTETDPTNADTDGDGLSDGTEDANLNGTVNGQETDPRKWDTDGGGESDGSEVLVTGHDPLDPSDDTVGPQPDVGPGTDMGVDASPADQGPGPDVGPVADLGVDGPAADLSSAPDQGPALDQGPSPDQGPTPDQGPQPDQALPPDQGPAPDQGAGLDAASPDAGVDAAAPDGALPNKDDLFLYGGGCGCTVTTGGHVSGLALVLLLGGALLLGLRRRRRRSRWLRWLPLLLLLGVADPARGQTIHFPVGNFQPAASPLNYYVTESAETLPSLVPSASLLFSYVHRPLELWNQATDRTDSEVIKYRFNMDLTLALGIGSRFEVGLGLPVTLAQDSQDNAVRLGVIESAVGPGIGDLRLVPKLRLVQRGPVALAVALPLEFPTGSDDNFLGADGVTFTPKAVVGVDTRRIDVGFNLGFRVRNKQNVQVSSAQEQVTINDDLLLSLGARVPLWKEKLALVADAFMAVAFEEQDKEEIPLELLAGLRYQLPKGLVANVGAGPGLTRGVGTPMFRIFAGLGYQYQPPPRKSEPAGPIDEDGDGLVGDEDLCPLEPEDRDSFEDDDGCPDKDNDNDGIEDPEDKCPQEAEDKDGFEDQDGCPDPDNDKDGIKDAEDKCPLKAEDKDGFEDDDGCPDPDNDKDGIPDEKDACPMEPETFNKVDDEDGCPDKGKGPVQIQRGKITVPPVFFATNKDVILKRSEPTLKQVAETLQSNTWVKRVRIEGHTDDRGKEAYNMDLSQRRADSVMRFLVGQGVDAARLEARGFGPTQPVASNKTPAGRAKNRRVEFVIVDPPQAQGTATPAPAAMPEVKAAPAKRVERPRARPLKLKKKEKK